MFEERRHTCRLGGRKTFGNSLFKKRVALRVPKIFAKNLSGLLACKGWNTQSTVAFRSLLRDLEGLRPSSRHTREFVATWICSSLLISAEIVSVQRHRRTERTGGGKRRRFSQPPLPLSMVWSGCSSQAFLSTSASLSALGSVPSARTAKLSALSWFSSSVMFISKISRAASGISLLVSVK